MTASILSLNEGGLAVEGCEEGADLSDDVAKDERREQRCARVEFALRVRDGHDVRRARRHERAQRPVEGVKVAAAEGYVAVLGDGVLVVVFERILLPQRAPRRLE